MKKRMTFGSQAIWNDALCAEPDPELCVPASRRVCLFESRSVHGVRLATGNVEYSVDQAGSFEPDQSTSHRLGGDHPKARSQFRVMSAVPIIFFGIA